MGIFGTVAGGAIALGACALGPVGGILGGVLGIVIGLGANEDSSKYNKAADSALNCKYDISLNYYRKRNYEVWGDANPALGFYTSFKVKEW